MSLTRLEPSVRASLRARLGGMGGVERVIFDDESREVALVVQCDADAAAIGRGAADAAAEFGLGPADLAVLVVAPAGAAREAPRVRFETIAGERRHDGTIRIRAELEWCGRMFTGDANADGPGLLELRAAAEATLAALESAVGEPLGIRLSGVKDVRAFDTSLLMVSLWRPGPPPQRFVGGVRMEDDPRRAVALAVLNALNRMLGNHLIGDRPCPDTP